MSEYISEKDVRKECQKICQKKCQQKCQKICQKICQKRSSEDMSDRTSLLNGLYWTPDWRSHHYISLAKHFHIFQIIVSRRLGASRRPGVWRRRRALDFIRIILSSSSSPDFSTKNVRIYDKYVIIWCHGGDHSKWSNFIERNTPPRVPRTMVWQVLVVGCKDCKIWWQTTATSTGLQASL